MVAVMIDPAPTTPARQRAALRRLIRRHGLRLVAGALGLRPETVARYQLGDAVSARTQATIDRGFCELGDNMSAAIRFVMFEKARELGVGKPKPPKVPK